ncbi:hypothetical protein CKO13_11725, partial [Halorhodospira neutriphila]|nr:hypothetical protein [Halorhodospira neutriphila]
LSLLAYAAILARYPLAWLWLLPAAVAVLDGSLLTGWLYLGAVDLLVVMSLAVALARWPAPGRARLLPRRLRWPLAVLALSTLIALGIGLGPLPPGDPGALSHYATPWNALRVAKGLLITLLLLLLARRTPVAPREQLERGLVPGMALGWLAATAVVLRERALYPGLLDFEAAYRVTGWFADMHVGGPSVETFLVLTLPFALLWGWRRRLGLLWTAAIAASGSYAALVTYSRGGWLGLAVALLLLAGLGGLALVRGWRLGGARAAALALSPAVVAAAVAWGVADGFAERRWSEAGADAQGRLARWQSILALPGGGAWTPWLGRGLGAFPEAYRYGNPGGRMPADFAFVREDGRGVLRLGSGGTPRLSQRLLLLPRDGPYTLEVRARGELGGRLRVAVCEEAILYRFACRSRELGLEVAADGWQRRQWRLTLEGLAPGPPGLRRGLVLSVTRIDGNPGVVEIDRLRLTGGGGGTEASHLRNGGFEHYGRHWYFTPERLGAWRTENQWLELYFDQGLLGLGAWLALLLSGLLLLLRRALAGAPSAAAALAGVGGALAIGLFSTIFFNPAIAVLFYLALLLGALAGASPVGRPLQRGAGRRGG